MTHDHKFGSRKTYEDGTSGSSGKVDERVNLAYMMMQNGRLLFGLPSGKVLTMKNVPYVLPYPPDGFESQSKYMATSMGLAISGCVFKYPTEYCEMMVDGLMEMPMEHRTLYMFEQAGCQRWYDRGSRVCFPDRSFVEGCQRTKVLSHITGNDVRTKYPSMLFTLPQGLRLGSRHEEDAYITHLMYNIYDYDENGMTIRYGNNDEAHIVDAQLEFKKHNARTTYKMGMPSGRFMVVNAFWTDQSCQSISIPLDSDNDQYLQDVVDIYSNERIRGLDDHQKTDETRDWESQAGQEALELVLNLCLLMQSYPQYVAPTEVKQKKFADKKKKVAKTSVLRLTRPVALVPEVPYDPDKVDSKGNGPDRRGHWRSGHWRRQRHSTAWEFENPEVDIITMPDGGRAHMVWIEPIWVDSASA